MLVGSFSLAPQKISESAKEARAVPHHDTLFSTRPGCKLHVRHDEGHGEFIGKFTVCTKLSKNNISCCGDDTIMKPRSATVTLCRASVSAQFLIEKTTTVSEQ